MDMKATVWMRLVLDFFFDPSNGVSTSRILKSDESLLVPDVLLKQLIPSENENGTGPRDLVSAYIVRPYQL